MDFSVNRLCGVEGPTFRKRIIRTCPLGSGLGVTTVPVLIRNTGELRAFLDNSLMGWQWQAASAGELRRVYDEAFFEGCVLIAGVVSAGSGSTKIDISDIIRTDDSLMVMFCFDMPPFGTADMMSWHYFVELSSADAGDREPKINLPVTEKVADGGRYGWMIADR